MDRRGVPAVDLALKTCPAKRTPSAYFAFATFATFAARNRLPGHQGRQKRPDELAADGSQMGDHGHRGVGWVGDARVAETLSLVQQARGVLAIHGQADCPVALLPRQLQEGIE